MHNWRNIGCINLQNVLFIGQMAAGKTFLANILKEEFNYVLLSLANPIKDLVYWEDKNTLLDRISFWLGNIPGYGKSEVNKLYQIINYAKENIPDDKPKQRKRLQFVGTEGGRKQIDDLIWIKILLSKIEEDKLYAVDDCRFMNEVEYLKNFIRIRIEIDESCRLERIKRLYPDLDVSAFQHESETTITSLPFDYTINGNLSYKEAKYHLAEMTKGAI